MNKTKIEWCDYTVNPVKGLCPMACPYCYARRMYKRYHWDETIRFDWSIANDLSKMKPGSKVFWGSTMELFGEWVEPEWMRLIIEATKRHSDLTHIFLTKQPQNLVKWSPFPDNCWVGVSATTGILADAACGWLSQIQATVKFVSIEPLLDGWGDGNSINNGRLGWQEHYRDISWLIIGQETPVSAKTTPKVEWIKEIVQAADKAEVPVFLKNNLKDLLRNEQGWTPAWAVSARKCDRTEYLRQEFP